jgi:hypothetical protein
MTRPSSKSGSAGIPLPQNLDYTITYQDVAVTEEKLRRLKAEQNAAPEQAKYGRFKAWLHYANLKRWQKQGHHFHYLSSPNQKHCTCGLVVNTQEVQNGALAEFVDPQIVQKLDGISLDDVQKVIGHKNLPSLRGDAIALIVDFEYQESFKTYLWTVICQRCGEFLVLVANADAQSFVKTHNKICSQARILKEEG